MLSRVVLAIGGEGVSGLLLVPDQSKRAKIVFAATARPPFTEHLDSRRLLAGTIVSLKRILGELRRAAPRPADFAKQEVDCFLTAPFAASQTRLIKLQSEKTLLITPKFVARLVSEDLAKAADVDHVVIESEVIETRLNGYAVETPYDQETSELEATLFVAVSAKKLLVKFEEVIRGSFHKHPPCWRAGSLAAARALASWRPAGHRFVLLELGAELTEVSLIQNGRLWDSGSFPFGHQTVLRQMVASAGGTPDEAVSALKLYLAGQYHEQAAARLSATLASAKLKWQAGLDQVLATFGERFFVPREIDLAVTIDWGKLFFDWLGERTVQMIEAKTLRDLIHCEPQANPDLPGLFSVFDYVKIK